MKDVVPRELANRDVEAAIDQNRVEANTNVAKGFVDALEKAFAHIARQPASGAARSAHQLGIAELRFCALRRFPYLVFYVERADHVDVWRVLHEQRDIPSWLNEE